MATINNEPLDHLYLKNPCHNLGDKCHKNNDCCSQLTCYSIQGMFFTIFVKKIKYSFKRNR
jgi:hypothetical protein